jgi:cellulose biosynthesis protein BcsQ
MRIFAVYNIKGGVGKTASAVNLAWLSARDGARTLIWDLDPQGAATYYFRVAAKVKGGSKKLVDGRADLDRLIRGTDYRDLDLLPADFSYRKMDLMLGRQRKPAHRLAELLIPMEATYDHVFLDCPPNITLLSEGIFIAADHLLVPTIPTTLSLRTLERLQRHLRKKRFRRVQVLPFFSMVDRRKSLHKRVVAAPPPGLPGFLRTDIPFASAVEQMGARRAPLVAWAPRDPASRAYDELWREILASVSA